MNLSATALEGELAQGHCVFEYLLVTAWMRSQDAQRHPVRAGPVHFQQGNQGRHVSGAGEYGEVLAPVEICCAGHWPGHRELEPGPEDERDELSPVTGTDLGHRPHHMRLDGER